MNIGYSLIIDEYVDTNQLVQADCELLRICCPVCLNQLELTQSGSSATLCHVARFTSEAGASCGDRVLEFTPEYRKDHNSLAGKQRLKFLHWHLFKELLNEDPIAHYETHAITILSNLKSKGALWLLSEWHLEMVADVYKQKLQDRVEFWNAGEDYLARCGKRFSHVPPSGFGRQVQFQIAYDLMQHVLSRKGFADDNYCWLFTHAFRLCMRRWTGAGDLGSNSGEEYPKDADVDARERIAAARILVNCCCDLISDDKREIDKGLEILTDLEMAPPITPVHMPFLTFLGIEVLTEMQATLCRLPYLPLLRLYERPCRPHLA